MNDREAEARGYYYTGIYEDTRERAKDKAGTILKQGYKIILVPRHASGYERIAGIKRGVILGYAVFTEIGYFNAREKNDLAVRLKLIENRRVRALKDYQEQLDNITKEEDKWKSRLKEL